IPALFLNLSTVLSLTSIGTLFAFVLVCGGILVLQNMKDKPQSKFKVPYINGKYIVPAMVMIGLVLVIIYSSEHFINVFTLDGLPMLLFWLVVIIVAVYTFKRNFSLIPVLGLISCFYLMAQETYLVWIRFLAWLILGLLVYFLYSYKNSKLAPKSK
ncbi:MAG TPA: amino acid permease C-terminal domain-containing protein, partial [Ferruginibacter sp.]|nr:amino acid permease C-terminal domain-containing protein [Ferruginibacter sp.]